MIGEEQLILVEVGEYSFCLPLNEVLSIIIPPKMARVPAERGAFIRTFKHHGELGSAVSIRHQLGLPEREDITSGQLLLGRMNGRLAGFWFDKVDRLLYLGRNCKKLSNKYSTDFNDGITSLISLKGTVVPQTTLDGLIFFKDSNGFKEWYSSKRVEIQESLSQDGWGDDDTEKEGSAVARFKHLTGEDLKADEADEEPEEDIDSNIDEQEQEVVEAPVEEDASEEATSTEQDITTAEEEQAQTELVEIPIQEEQDDEAKEQKPDEKEEEKPDTRFALEGKRKKRTPRISSAMKNLFSKFQRINISEASWTRFKRRVIKPGITIIMILLIASILNGAFQYSDKRTEQLDKLVEMATEQPRNWNKLRETLVTEMKAFYELSLSLEHITETKPQSESKQ